jgi:hypothetical protein
MHPSLRQVLIADSMRLIDEYTYPLAKLLSANPTPPSEEDDTDFILVPHLFPTSNNSFQSSTMG